MDARLRIAGIASIISAIILLPSWGVGIAATLLKTNIPLQTLRVVLTVISIPISILILRGYLAVGDLYGIVPLKYFAWLTMGWLFIYTPLQIFFYFYPSDPMQILSIILLIVAGLLLIFMGISLLKLRKAVGALATAVAISQMVVGGLLVSIFFLFLLPFIDFILTILEAWLFLKLARKH